MIVYFDTSALVATYVVDTCSPMAMKARRDASAITTSILAYPEALSALASLVRRRAISRSDREKFESLFVTDWLEFQRIRFEARLLPDIRRMLRRHPLKAADAIHLASACSAWRSFVAVGKAMSFACDDRALAAAAVAEGLTLAW